MIRISIVPDFDPQGNTAMDRRSPAAPPFPDRDPPSQAPTATIDSTQILRGSQEVAIAHNGRLYRLRNTRNGKLILT